MIGDWLALAYPWTKALHVISVIAWMAGLFYLPRLFVYHAERAQAGSELEATLIVMERKLLKLIINPAGVATWIFGLMLVFTPGVIDWSTDIWAHVKAALVIGMTVFYHSLVRWQRAFEQGRNTRPGRYFRLMNEVPTLLMVGIVIMVIVKPF
ncbi:MAG: protoporphyrinogen oxidase HemJ [Thermohalobaculum sp.]|nr:protoporphyrinogen oxidase HemJ [Thermohalobaculum sp.]